jgi:peptide/nickel transport system permease protein
VKHLLPIAARRIGAALACGLGASLLVLLLVVAAGGGARSMTPCGTAGETSGRLISTWIGWFLGLWSTGMGDSWACTPLSDLLPPVGRSAFLVAAVLLLSCAGAMAWVALDTWREHRPEDGAIELSSTAFMAPPVVWAAMLTVAFNMTVAALSRRHPEWDLRGWSFPMAAVPLRQWAAVLVLSLGGGTLWELRTGLRADLERVLQQDFILVARANGLSVTGRVVRNLAVPFGARVVSKVPLLLGEVIVVEYIFLLDGVGRELINGISRRDAPALMTVTFLFVLMTLLMRAGIELLSAWLTPALREEVA